MEDAALPSFGSRYRVVKQLGKGGMAEVYQAIDTTLDRIVAVKVMLPQFAEDNSFARRFKNEAKAAARLTSPYVVNIYDWGENDSGCFIVMEYVRGIDLKQALLRRGPIHPRKVAEIGAQVCSALAEAHRRNIIHRDIKPANIMIQATGDAKIMDFGIARAGAGQTGTTRSMLIGTAAYMAPEQLRGQPATGRSDLYSLGVTLYELCTGVLPSIACIDRLDTDARYGTPIPPQHLSERIDERLSAILMHALEPDPSQRYENAAAMQVALETYLAQPVEANDRLDYPEFWALGFTQGPDGICGKIAPVREACIVGRSSHADLFLDDPSVSSRHARLISRGLYLEVEDLGSIHGTKLNGNFVNQRTLCRQGASIDFGAVRARVGRK